MPSTHQDLDSIQNDQLWSFFGVDEEICHSTLNPKPENSQEPGSLSSREPAANQSHIVLLFIAVCCSTLQLMLDLDEVSGEKLTKRDLR